MGFMVTGVLLTFVLAAVFNALIIWVVSKLNLGLRVKSFGSAIVAAIVIALVSAILTFLLGSLGISVGTGILGPLVSLIVAAIVLLISGNLLPNLEVRGFWGAILAAIAMALLTWLATTLVGLL